MPRKSIKIEEIHEDEIEFRAQAAELPVGPESKPLKTEKSASRPAKRKRPLKALVFMSVFFVMTVLVFGKWAGVSHIDQGASWFAQLPVIKQIKHLAESSERLLKGEDRDRINVLLLGMGGSRHEGGYLTDTIMILSIEPSTKKVAMVSIPRDLAVPVENMGWQKINAVNAYAEMAEPGSGGLAIAQTVMDMFQIPIDYFIRVDFEGFINIVDELGGIAVFVENTLDDYSYPIMGNEEAEWEYRYEHLHVPQGWQDMDGSLALKFARSRYGIRGEGSDFARARRQQQIMSAVKDKTLTLSNLFKPVMIINIYNEVSDHVSTNLKAWEILRLYDLAKEVDAGAIVNKVLEPGQSGLLVEGRSSIGAYILKPRSGDFAEIQYFINNIFAEAPAESRSLVSRERSTIEVRNGTWINGLASQTAVDLEKYGFYVVRVGNSSRQNFQKSVIYDLTYGEKNDSLAVLKEKTGANIAYSLPDWLIKDIKHANTLNPDPIQPNFILIVGQDADVTESGLENLN